MQIIGRVFARKSTPKNGIKRKVFEVENVLLRTREVKRNAGEGTPARYLPFFICNVDIIPGFHAAPPRYPRPFRWTSPGSHREYRVLPC